MKTIKLIAILIVVIVATFIGLNWNELFGQLQEDTISETTIKEEALSYDDLIEDEDNEEPEDVYMYADTTLVLDSIQIHEKKQERPTKPKSQPISPKKKPGSTTKPAIDAKKKTPVVAPDVRKKPSAVTDATKKTRVAVDATKKPTSKN